MLARFECFEKLKKILGNDKLWQRSSTVYALAAGCFRIRDVVLEAFKVFPPVALRSPLCLDNSSQRHSNLQGQKYKEQLQCTVPLFSNYNAYQYVPRCLYAVST